MSADPAGVTKALSGPRVLETERESEADLAEATQPFPAFPKLVGVLDELASSIAPSLAYEQKALYLLIVVGLHLSGRVKLATDPWLQPRFYGCAISPPGQTKSAVDKEVRRVLFPEPQQTGGREMYAFPPLPEPKIGVEFSVNSGPALVQLLEENRRVLLVPDELAGMFEKARQTVNSPNTLFNELLRLYESNETGRTVVRRRGESSGHIKLTDAHLAVYGGATPQSFDKMWQGTGGAGAGLQSRFVLAYSDCPPPPFQKLADENEVRRVVQILLERLRDAPETLMMSAEAQTLVIEWTASHKDGIPSRSLDMAKRAAMVLAATGELRTVDTGAMAWGLAFADYQIELKARLMPADADNSVQAFENRIVGVYQRNGRATKRQVRRALHPERYPGGFAAYEKAMTALIRSGRLKTVGQNHAGSAILDLD